MKSTWDKMDTLKESDPGPALRSRFYAMLEAEKRSLEEEKSSESEAVRKPIWETIDNWLSVFWPKKPVAQLGLSFCVLIFGLWIGGAIPGSGEDKHEMQRLRGEVREMRQFMSVSLMSQPSTVSRMQGVSLSTQVQNPDVSLLETLFEKIESDPNVNVRLAAVDAMLLFCGEQQVQTRLMETLKTQNSPLVQVALIDLISTLQHQKALDALKKLINSEKVHPDVKAYAEQKQLEIS